MSFPPDCACAQQSRHGKRRRPRQGIFPRVSAVSLFASAVQRWILTFWLGKESGREVKSVVPACAASSVLQACDLALENIYEPYANEPIDHQNQWQEAEQNQCPSLAHQFGEQLLPRQEQRR